MSMAWLVASLWNRGLGQNSEMAYRTIKILWKAAYEIL